MSSAPADYGDPSTRERILEAAQLVVEQSGPDFRMAEVARAAGVSRQSVYLHFTDRSGLMLSLVRHIDDRHAATRVRQRIRGAESGADSLRAWIEMLAGYAPVIDRIAEVLEAGAARDNALAAAWRDRMDRRRAMARWIVARLQREGELNPAWTVEDAADMAYAVTMPGVWRELTRSPGWDRRRYADRVFRLLADALVLADRRPSD